MFGGVDRGEGPGTLTAFPLVQEDKSARCNGKQNRVGDNSSPGVRALYPGPPGSSRLVSQGQYLHVSQLDKRKGNPKEKNRSFRDLYPNVTHPLFSVFCFLTFLCRS